MCATHNLHKSDRRVQLEDYRREMAERGELMVKSFSDVVDLTWRTKKRPTIMQKPKPVGTGGGFRWSPAV